MPFLLFGLFGCGIAWLYTRLRSSGGSGDSQTWIIGDSQACGASTLSDDLNPDHGFLEGVRNGLNVRCKIGSRVADWNPVIETIPLKQGDRVAVFLGSNEMGNTPDASVITKSILRRGAKVLWVGPPLIRGKSGPAIASLRTSCQKAGGSFFDSTSLALKQKDGVHATPSEFQRWLTAVLSKLVKM